MAHTGDDRAWLDAVKSGHPPGEFGHREHLLLAWLVLEASPDAETAQEQVSHIIRAIANAQGVPQRYNRTVTDAWVRIVAHCRGDATDSFDTMLQLFPWLLDKRALLSHFSSRVLASETARREWVEPDLMPIP